MTPNQDRDVQAAFDGRLTSVELRDRLTQAQNAIVAVEAERDLYRSQWLSCVTQEEAQRLRDAMNTARSLLRGLPASKTATDIDKILAYALGEP